MQQRIPTSSSKREMHWRILRSNFYLSTRDHPIILRNPRDISEHDPGTVADRLYVNNALPVEASRVLHLLIWGDDRGEDRSSQFKRALERRVQANVGGRVGGVRF